MLGTKAPAYRLAADSDLYKWLEGACYVFARSKDPAIKQEIDRIVGLIVTCQADDGYINTQAQKERWDPKVKHDLYIAGHLFEAAAAHYRVTGEKGLLDAACAWADYLISQYKKGNPYYTTTALKEHSEYELGLLRLYRATGNRSYLEFSITLAKALCRVGPKVADVKAGGGLHAVRVGYLLAGMADLYLETGSDEMLQHLPGLWGEMVNTRMYVTGAIGSHGEGISKTPYDLPHTREHPERILGETCASVAMIMFSWRMHGITGESRYFDVIENTLYNHYFGAIALNGKGTFYYNPMRMIGDQSKHSDHGHRPVSSRRMLPKINRTACCPSNMWRFFGALPEYLFSFDQDGLFVNLYSRSEVRQTLSDGRQIALSVDTEYPHKGDVRVRFDGKRPTPFKLRLRIPAWCQSATAQWPGQETRPVQGGDTLVIDRTWQKADTVQLQFDMPVRMILPDPKVRANAGQVVFARGPVLFCLEKEDVDFPVEKARVAIRPEEVTQRVGVTWHPDLLDGIHMLHVPGLVDGKAVDLKLVPWSVRANRSEDSRWLIFLPLAGATGGAKEKLVVLSEHQGPVIGPDHPDVKASGNRSGFETGQLIKHKGVYHMFVNEMFGQHHIDMRSSHWTSPDAVNWKRQSTVVDRVPGRSHTNLRSEVWLTGVEYNDEDAAWNIFFVSYRAGNRQAGELFGSDYEGRIWRGRSTVPGPDGIDGPYEDIEIILEPDEHTQTWEGQQAVDSFNPYKVGDKCYGFYGGHYHTPRGPWPVGLAVADKLAGPWKRMPAGFNPIPIVKVFIENPVVSRLPDGRYLAIFDSLGAREIGYSLSQDGLTWPPETRLTAQTGSNKWAGDGDHDMRTALCAVREDDGSFTVVYTAKMKDRSFWAVGKCTLGWADLKE